MDEESEGDYLSGIYEDFDGHDSFEYELAERQYRRGETLATLCGLGTSYRPTKRKDKKVYMIIQDSRKDNTVLLLVDRRKSKEYWWTHDLSLAYKGSKEDMNKIVKKLTKNNVRVISCSEYYKYKSEKI